MRIWKLIDKENVITKKIESKTKEIGKLPVIKTKNNVEKRDKTITKTKTPTKSKTKTQSKTKAIAKKEDKRETIKIPLGNGDFRTYKVLKKLDTMER